MRPLSLEMHAFGAYAGSESLDFRELGDRSLFLIHGPTGSGKSTILDAICFALYGETSGDERKGGQMRSDHAPPELKTRVVYEFALGEQIYRIERTPRYEVLRDDGETTRTIQPSAELWCRDASADPDEPGDLLASKVTDVRARVETLLGLRPDQFRQVVVLPQGKFRELLTASSSEREKIFSTLFQTHHYRFIQDKLKERARAIQNDLEAQRQQRRNVLELAGVSNTDELTTKIEEAGQAIAQLTERRTSQDSALKDARAAFEQAREADRKLREVNAARELLGELDQRRDEIDRDRRIVERARRAAQLVDSESNMRARIEEAEKSEAARDELERLTAEAKEILAKAEQAKQQADELHPQIERLSAKHQHLELLRPRITRLTDAETKLHEAEAKVREQENAHSSAKSEHERLSAELKTAQNQLNSAQLQASQVGGLDGKLNSLKRLSRQREQFDQAQADLDEAVDQQDKATTALETADRRLKDAQKTLDVLEDAWRRGQAAVLAGQLEDDRPCPVCGSVHHPSPAVSDEAIPDEDQLERHRAEVESARHNRDQASNNRITADQRVQNLAGRVEELREELADAVDTPLPDLETQVSEAERALQVATDEAGKIETLTEQVDTLDDKVEDLQRRVDAANDGLNQARSDEVAARTAYETALQEVPDEYRSLEALDAAVEATSKQVEDLANRVEQARKDLDAARSKHTNLSAQLESARHEAAQDRERADDASHEFARRRLQQGFADDEDYQKARLAPEHVDQLDTQIKQYDQQLTIARDRLTTAEKNAEGLHQPDLTALEEAVQTAEAELNGIVSDLAEHDSQVKNLRRAAAQVAETVENIDQLNKQYEVAEYLSSVANGEATYSNHRISFERFVLGTFLDEVLIVATDKLRTMTNGRFQLVRKLYGSDGRRSTGLDLEVEDAYTGTARDVSTLSGGEGFLAALAMALGMSDVVQSRAGGIRLETLFVDEGFGSLDPDALDRSLNMLVDLHQGRLVGIISHVPELQERIDVRLRVEARRDGSTARFALS